MTEPLTPEDLAPPPPSAGGVLSLDDAPATTPVTGDPDKLSLANTPPPLDQQAVNRRAIEANFGLGNKSPGVDALKNAIGTGTDQFQRDSDARRLQLEEVAQRTQMVRDMAAQQKGPVTQEQADQIMRIGTTIPQVDASTVWEMLYGKAVLTQAITTVSTAFDTFAKGFGFNPSKALDMTEAASEVITKKRIVQARKEELEARMNEMGQTSKAIDFLADFVPGKAWWQLKNAAGLSKLNGIPAAYGSTLEEVVTNLSSLPIADFNRRVTEIYDTLAKTNVFDAMKFLNAVDSYTTDDKFLDNVFSALDVVTAPGIGALSKGVRAGAKAIAGKAVSIVSPSSIAAKAVEGGGVLDKIKDIYKGIIKTHDAAAGPVKAEEVLTAAGDLKKAAEYSVWRQMNAQVKNLDPLNARDMITNRLISWLNPTTAENVLTNPNLSAEATRRITSVLGDNAERLLSTITKVNTIDRLTPEALRVAFDEAWAAVDKKFTHINDSVLDVGPIIQRNEITPEKNPFVNTGAVQVLLGKTDGTVFTTEREAANHAANIYKLGEDYQIVDRGAGYAISVHKYVDETSDKVREALLINTKNRKDEGGFFASIARGLRSADDVVPEFQRANRKQVITGINNIEAQAREISKVISSLSKKERSDLGKVLEDGRDAVETLEDGTTKYGRWHDTVGSLQLDYMVNFKRLPTEKEIAAYFTYKQLSDFDYVVRNATIFRDKARLGIEEVSLRVNKIDDKGRRYTYSMKLGDGGKFVDDLPWDLKDWSVYIHHNDPTVEGAVLKATEIAGDQRKTIEGAIANGFKVVQIANPAHYPLESLAGKVPVNYILTKDFERTPLKWNQLPYQEGGHKSYATQWFVKQPVISRSTELDGKTAHTFDGDTSIMGFGTQAEAKKYAEYMDQARVLLKDRKIDELKTFLADKLPFDYQKFKALFTEGVDAEGKTVAAKLNIDDPITHVFSGRRTSDPGPGALDFKKLYPNFVDNIRSPHNLMDKIDKEYAGQKNMDLWSVNERDPIYKLTTAQKIDPFKTMNDSIANVMRNRLMGDYKISAVETWVQEYGDLLKNVPPEQLKANPIYYLHNGEFDKQNPNNARLSLASAQRNAILRLLGTDSDIGRNINATRMKLMDSIYSKYGQATSDAITFSDIYKQADPFKYGREVAFMTHLALWNPVQLFLQAQTLTHTLAIAGPVNGLAGTAAGTLMSLLRYTENPKIIDSFAQKAGMFGMKPEWFKESYAEMQHSGLWHVGGESGWRQGVLDPKLFQSSMGALLDKSAVFFNEGERLTRMAAHNAAYLEWRKANPQAVLNNDVRRQIADRRDMMTVNMMRDANASWQQGVMSIPTQFMGYQARLSEQLLGARLTTTEKARAMTTYSLMYGIPAGTAAFTGAVPFIPDGDDLRKWALENGNKWMGVNFDNTAIKFATDGFAQMMTHMLTGTEFNVSARMGPNNIWKNILGQDKSFMDVVFGASGSTFMNMKKSADPFAKSLMSAFSSDPNTQYTPQPEDFLALANNVSTVSQITKTVWALNTGFYFNKNGIKQSEITPFQAIFAGITGTTPKSISDAQLMTQSMADTKKAQQETEKLLITAMSNANNAMGKGDFESYEKFMRLVKIYTIAGGWQDKDIPGLFAKATASIIPQVGKVGIDFWKNAPKDQQGARMDMILNPDNNK